MSNHFLLLVYVHEAPKLIDKELFGRIVTLYSGARLIGNREMHEKSIHLVPRELADEHLAGLARKGLPTAKDRP